MPRPPRSDRIRRRSAPATPYTSPARSGSIPRPAICARAPTRRRGRCSRICARWRTPRAADSTTWSKSHSCSPTWLTSRVSTKSWRAFSPSPIRRARLTRWQRCPRAPGLRSRRCSSCRSPGSAPFDGAAHRVAGLSAERDTGTHGDLCAPGDRFAHRRATAFMVLLLMAGKKRAAAEPKPGNTLADKLVRLGIAREQDLVLHLPLRYEDHTHLCPLAALKPGQPWQVEATVANTDIQYRPRRQLVCLLEDGDAQLVLRFFHFYPSHQKALAVGKRVRAFGDVREGHFGLEMVHPSFHVVAPGTPLPDRLTPVYPTTAGLAQDALRKLVHRALLRDPAYLGETLPPWTREPRRLWGFAQSVHYLHEPPTDASQSALDARTHPAWSRLKFDELLA